MFRNNFIICAYIWATIFTATIILGQHQHQFYRKPWPTYSLQNMPQTQFTCHDKILGGYYADAETQCQMFHVCVKVAGVGVQDFRFLCPNGTAFDQEAQICADWGDVDCEQSVLYYGSDNFDLYRLGSGFESKRAPLAEEEEATFHLQRAESADVRRSKETRIDQKSRPEQPPNYTKHYEAATTRNFYANHNYGNLNNANEKPKSKLNKQTKQIAPKPIANLYTPTSTTTTSTTTTTERSNSIDESRQDFDDIFKGSHSSHFFSNRNGGREDDLLDYQPHGRSKQNDFVDFNKKTESSTAKTRLQTARSRRIQNAASTTTTTKATTAKSTTTRLATTTLAPTTKKLTLHASFNADSLSPRELQHQTKTKLTSTTTTFSPISTTTKSSNNANRLKQQNDFYLTQEKIQPTTYNPGNSIYRYKTTPTPKHNNDVNRHAGSKQQSEKSKAYNKPTVAARKIQKLERTQKLDPRNSTFVNKNEFNEFAKIKTEQPKPFQPVQTFRAPLVSAPAPAPAHNQEPQYHRSRAQQVQQQSRVGHQEPAPFSTAATKTASRNKPTTTPTPELIPRGFSNNRGSINYKASTQRENLDYFNPSTTQSVKKFSTLVPRENYQTPTTFKPTATHKSAINNDYNYYLTQQTKRPANSVSTTASTTKTSAVPTTANPYYNPDEDDGQYHPELYEVDFPRNRLSLQRGSTANVGSISTTTTSTTKKPFAFNHRFDSPQTHLKTQQQSAFQKQHQQEQSTASSAGDLSDEDELFKTAHSLNFGAASINKLRADIIKAEKTSQIYNSQYSPNLVLQSSSPNVTAAPATTSRSTIFYTFPTTYSTPKSFSPTISSSIATTSTTTTTTTTTTKRPFHYLPNTTVVSKSFDKPLKPTKVGKSSKGNKGKKASGSKTASSKRPPHADEDTSYDYAYYDTDTLSESPQEYPEYEIAEFTKTRKN